MNDNNILWMIVIYFLLLLVNLIQFFFFFFFSYKGKEGNTYVSFLIMILSFYRSIKYSNFIIKKFEFFSNKINELAKLFIEKFDIFDIKKKYGDLYESNVFIHTLQFSCIFFEICYCYEYIKIFKNPVSLGGDIHYLSILVPLIYLIIKYFFIKKDDYFWIIILIICMIIYIFVTIYSLFIICQANSNLIIKKSSQYLLIRHIFYILLFLLVFTNCVYTTSSEKESLFRTFLFGIFEVLLIIVRLGEIKSFQKNKKLTLDNLINETLSEDDMSINESLSTINNKSLILNESSNSIISVNSSKLSKILESQINNKNSSEKVHTSIILLSIYYIIEGINFIVSDYDDSEIKINEYGNKNKYQKQYFLQIEEMFSHELTYYDYEIQNNNLIQISKNENKKLSTFKKLFSNQVYLVEYYPDIFKKLRRIDNIKNESLIESFNFQLNIKNFIKVAKGEGKSGSLFFMTHDKKYFLKTISNKDLNSFKNIFIKDYYKLIIQNHYSLLVRIYGVYTIHIGVSHINMILMENISPFHSHFIKYKFDLKGSSYKRNTKNLIHNRRKKTLKDLDFLDIIKMDNNLILINSFQKELVEGIIKNDLNLLTKCYLMDYSLFIAVLEYNPEITKQTKTMRMYVSKDKKYVYYIGIIDYLSYYGIRKKIETIIKNFFLCKKENKTNISAVSPLIYSQRFFKFMTRKVFNQKREKTVM